MTHDLDVCVCGCYRKNHIDGAGLCRLCTYANGELYDRCTGFRLAYPAQTDFEFDSSITLT